MATCTSKASGDWSAGSTWDTDPNPPANLDTVIIANTHTVTFDVDMSGWANGVILTINAGGTLNVKDDAGTYYLKSNAADITVNGDWTIGTSIAVPFTGTFTVDFNSAAKSIEVSATGHLYWYCAQPTNRYVTSTAQAASGQKNIIVTPDVSAEWAIGDDVCIVDSTPRDVQVSTITNIVGTTITINDNFDSTNDIGSLVINITRNIRVINVASADYAITYASGSGNGDYVGAQLKNVYRGITGGQSYEFAGAVKLLTTSPYALSSAENLTMTGVLCGTNYFYGIYSCQGAIIGENALIAGAYIAVQQCSNVEQKGRIFGCSYGYATTVVSNLTSTASVEKCTIGFNRCGNSIIYGDITGNGTGFIQCDSVLISNTTLNNTIEFDACYSGKAYNVIFTGNEFDNYNSITRHLSSYFESFNHDQVENAYKAWCRGGIVTSQSASPPTGYTLWYEHACEDTTGVYPCFRQYETTVLPGTAIEVQGKIRIADGEDMTGREPALQIIDKFADPLVDSTQNPLDEDEIPLPTGEAGWQDVSVIWANQGDSPRQVIVRMIAWCHSGGATDIDSVWSIATYQDQVQAIYNKLPTNYIMGSSVQSDKDDEIDAILVDTGTTIPGLIATAQADLDIITGTNGVLIDDDAIKSSKFDESTAFPVKKADTGSTEIARTGADGDTLETLSDQLDEIKADTEEIISNTGRVVNVYPTGERTVITGGATLGVEDEKE